MSTSNSVLGYSKKSKKLGFTQYHPHQINSGDRFDMYFGEPTGTHVVLKESGSVYDTIQIMGQWAMQHAKESAKIAKVLKGKSLKETVTNIEDFIQSHIPYRLDGQSNAGSRKIGDEELTTPSFLWANRKNKQTPADCDDISGVFPSTILQNLGIKHYLRMANYGSGFQHVYTVVPIDQESPLNSQNTMARSEYLVIDPVLAGINNEKPFVSKYDEAISVDNNLGLDPFTISLAVGLLAKINWSKVGKKAKPAFDWIKKLFKSDAGNESWYKGEVESKPKFKAVMDGLNNGTSFNIDDALYYYNYLNSPGGFYFDLVNAKKLTGYQKRRKDIITQVALSLEKGLTELDTQVDTLQADLEKAAAQAQNSSTTKVSHPTSSSRKGKWVNLLTNISSNSTATTTAQTNTAGFNLPKPVIYVGGTVVALGALASVLKNVLKKSKA